MIIINMAAFRGERADAKDAIRDLLAPYLHEQDHTHRYGIVLASHDAEEGYELEQFEAPCPVSDPAGNIHAVVHALRAAADATESGHADLLEAHPAPTQCDGVGPNELLCQMTMGHDGMHSDGVEQWPADSSTPAGE